MTWPLLHYWDCYPKVVSPKGYDLDRQARHDISHNVSLSGDVPFSGLCLVNRKRTYQSDIGFEYRGKGLSWESWDIVTHDNIFLDGVWAENYHGNLRDTIIDESLQILYMDIRNGIIAYKKITTQITIEDQGIRVPTEVPQAFINGGIQVIPDEYRFSFVMFPGVKNTKIITTEYYVSINNSVRIIATETEQEQRDLNIVLYFGKGQQNQVSLYDLNSFYDWQPPYTGIGENPLFDGYDYFEPFWHDEFVSSDIDRVINELHRDYYGNNGSDTDTREIFYMEDAIDPTPQGSWAVSVDGDVFVSQKAGNIYYNVIVNAKGGEDINPVPLAGLADEPLFFPVAPI